MVVPIFDLANHRHGAAVGAKLQPSLSETEGQMELHTCVTNGFFLCLPRGIAMWPSSVSLAFWLADIHLGVPG